MYNSINYRLYWTDETWQSFNTNSNTNIFLTWLYLVYYVITYKVLWGIYPLLLVLAPLVCSPQSQMVWENYVGMSTYKYISVRSIPSSSCQCMHTHTHILIPCEDCDCELTGLKWILPINQYGCFSFCTSLPQLYL